MTRLSLMRGAVAAATLALLPAGAASAEVYMKAASAPGEATAKGFEQQIILQGASLSISNMSMVGEDGVTPETYRMVGNVMVNKMPDRASPRLALAAVDGEEIGTVEITFTEPATRSRPQTVKARWILEGAEIRSFAVYPGASPAEPSSESVEIAYKSMRYQVITPSPNGQSGTTDEVQWSTPDDQELAGWQPGCG